jgi:hypothetical protein
MCLGLFVEGGSKDPGARQHAIPVLPPNVLMLGQGAREQLRGQGEGIQSLKKKSTREHLMMTVPSEA